MDGLLITSATKSTGINTCLTHCLPISGGNVGSVVSRPGAGPCAGMDVATESPGTDSRRVPTPDATPRRRPTPHTDQPAHEVCRCYVEASVYGGRLHAYRRGTRRKYVRVGSGAASMPLKVPHRHARKHHRLLSVAERNANSQMSCTFFRAPIPGGVTADGWLTDYIGHGVHRHRDVLEALLAYRRRQCWERGAVSGGGTVWRHGCRHRASRDGFTACPDTGCGAAPPTDSAYRSFLCTTSRVPRECFGLLRAIARVPAWDTPQVRPCRRWRGIHAAQGPTPARAQAPPVFVDG
ncbi:hypothetical protein FHY13_000735 [Xanthomonas arboricola]|nr:hypothetical protein [Xanthomonas euroxanthea]